MRLTLDQQKHVAQHLNSRGSAPKCSVCGASNLTVLAEITLLPSAGTDGAENDASGGLRVANVQCNFCGHILHFSVDAIGLDLAP